MAYLTLRLGVDRIIPHAPYSPDCNAIENLFGILSRKMKSGHIYNSSDDLWTAIEFNWNNLDSDRKTLENLALSMPRRYQEVLDKNGGSTHY
jgi:hypothetical protein